MFSKVIDTFDAVKIAEFLNGTQLTGRKRTFHKVCALPDLQLNYGPGTS